MEKGLAYRVILDTNFMVDLLRKKKGCLQVTEELEGRDTELYTTAINAYELRLGALKLSKVKETDSFLRDIEVLPVDLAASIATSNLQHELSRKGQLLEHRDALIAGTAIANNIVTIVSNDTDFKKVEKIEILTYR